MRERLGRNCEIESLTPTSDAHTNAFLCLDIAAANGVEDIIPNVYDQGHQGN